jgi:hypothetical protein
MISVILFIRSLLKVENSAAAQLARQSLLPGRVAGRSLPALCQAKSIPIIFHLSIKVLEKSW